MKGQSRGCSHHEPSNNFGTQRRIAIIRTFPLPRRRAGSWCRLDEQAVESCRLPPDVAVRVRAQHEHAAPQPLGAPDAVHGAVQRLRRRRLVRRREARVRDVAVARRRQRVGERRQPRRDAPLVRVAVEQLDEAARSLERPTRRCEHGGGSAKPGTADAGRLCEHGEGRAEPGTADAGRRCEHGGGSAKPGTADAGRRCEHGEGRAEPGTADTGRR